MIVPAIGRKNNEEYIASWKMEPLSLAVLAGLTPPDIEVEMYDDRLEDIPYDKHFDLVAINAESYTAKRAYGIALKFRKLGVPVVLGGYHPTLFPEEAVEHCDAIVIGEAENVWEQLLKDVKAHHLQKIYRSSSRPDISRVKTDRSIFKGKKYMPLTLIETGRGCRFNCNFCSINAFYKGSYCHRDPKEIVREIQSINAKSIFFVDDNIVADPEFARVLFNELIPLKIRWVSQCSMNMLADDGFVKLMVKSGCIGLLIGFESLNKKNLAQMNKGWGDVTKSDTLKMLSDNGVAIYATFVFGYDHDDKATFEKTLEFAIKEKFFLAAFNHLMPFPGTKLYQQFKDEGRLLYEKWWLDPNYQYGDIAFKPRLLTPEQLTEYSLQARRDFFSYRSILARMIPNCRSLFLTPVYFSTNLLLKKEVDGKRGIKMGEGMEL